MPGRTAAWLRCWSWVSVRYLPAALVGVQGLGPEVPEHARIHWGKAAEGRLRDWEVLMCSERHRPERGRLAAVNAYLNRIDCVDDRPHWRRHDYRATPVETLDGAAGGCVDLAIVTYPTLREVGVPDPCPRITYVKARRFNQAPGVLACYSEWEVAA